MKSYLLCFMKSLVTDYAVILYNTNLDILPNICNPSWFMFMKHLTTYMCQRLQLIQFV